MVVVMVLQDHRQLVHHRTNQWTNQDTLILISQFFLETGPDHMIRLCEEIMNRTIRLCEQTQLEEIDPDRAMTGRKWNMSTKIDQIGQGHVMMNNYGIVLIHAMIHK